MPNTSEVCMVMNLDCYKFDDLTLVREASFSGVRGNLPESFTFDLTDCVPTTEEGRRAVHFYQQRVHGLDFLPMPGEEPLSPKVLDDLITLMYRKYSNRQQPVVGFYTGREEEEHLGRLRIPSMDLSTVYMMYRMQPGDNYHHLTCGFHANGFRCGRAVVTAYRDNLIYRGGRSGRY